MFQITIVLFRIKDKTAITIKVNNMKEKLRKVRHLSTYHYRGLKRGLRLSLKIILSYFHLYPFYAGQLNVLKTKCCG